MKSLYISILFTLFSMLSYAQVDRTQPPQAGEPSPLDLGKMQSFRLKNGLKVFLAQSKGYPKFTMSINTQQPGFDDEDRKEAKGILDKAYMKKLSQKYPNGEIDSIANYLGAMLTSTVFTGNLKGMKRDLDQLLDLYTDLLMNPLIKEEYITEKAENYQKKLERKKKETAKKEKKKNGMQISSHLLDSLIYGKKKEKEKEDPILNYDTLKTEDILKFRKERVVANNTLIVVVGDFTLSECKKIMENYFGHWESGKPYVREDKNDSGNPAIKNRTIVVIDNPNAVQSKISLHWPMKDAFPYFDKDTELNILNEIFGSSQMSYLYRNLREDKGLCYSIRSSIGASGGGGNGSIYTSVRNDQTALAIENIILEMIRIRNEEVNEHDLNIAKNSLIGEFSRSLSVISPMLYISFAMSKEVYNLPDDYLQTRIPHIYKVTQKDILEMAKKYINPFECLIIVKGKASELKGSLEKFGNISYLDKEGNEIVN